MRARDRLLWQGDGIGGLRLLQLHAHIQARQQIALGIGHFSAQRNLAGGRVHRQIGKQQASWLAVGRTVFQHDAHACGVLAARFLELAALHGTAQLQGFAGGLREVDVHRVDLLNDRQRRGFALPDQRAFGHQRAADAARDRRRHAGVVQVDAAGLHGGFANGHIGLGLLVGGHGIGVLLLADGIGRQQRLVAVGQRLGLDQVGLGAGQRGLGALQGSGVGRSVNGEQRLPGLDIAAFAEQALLHDSGGTGAHLGLA